MYAAPPRIEAEVHARLPDDLRLAHRHSAWAAARGGGALHSFLEGPSFDRDGNLYCVDIPHGRVLRVSPAGAWSVVAQWDGEPNGLKIHRDGRLFVADRMRGLVVVDPRTGADATLLAGPPGENFHGLNDLTFASNGDLYLTDQGDSHLLAPFGRVFRLRATGELDLLAEGLAGPNGLVLDRTERLLYVAVTRTNQIVTVPLYGALGGKCGTFIQLSGSPVGPDGLALDQAGNLAIVHAGFGTVWLFSRLGEPVLRIASPAGMRTTNLAYGGPDGRSLFITEAEEGVILRAALPEPGQLMFAQSMVSADDRLAPSSPP